MYILFFLGAIAQEVALSLILLICPSIIKEFFLSLKSFNGVTRTLKECLKSEGCFKGVVSKNFQESFLRVSRDIQ